jgi:ABC-type phosphate/phosphonate transport system substrate-binding protein
MCRLCALVGCCAILVVSISATEPAVALEPKSPTPIRIGVLPTMYRGDRPSRAAAIREPLLDEVEARTGLDCEFVVVLTSSDMSRQLSDGRLQFGLCQGFEFAWMKTKEPKLKALMVALPVHRPLKAFLVVASSNPAKSLCELKGKTLAIPNGSHAIVNLFADRKCRCEGKSPKEIFKSIEKPENAETALHQLYENEVQAAVVDGAALQGFAERYPARSKFIHTLMESEPFPMSVVVTHDGIVDSHTLSRFRSGMQKATASVMGRKLMGLMHSAGFEAVPANYDEQLADFVKRYPPEQNSGLGIEKLLHNPALGIDKRLPDRP